MSPMVNCTVWLAGGFQPATFVLNSSTAPLVVIVRVSSGDDPKLPSPCNRQPAPAWTAAAGPSTTCTYAGLAALSPGFGTNVITPPPVLFVPVPASPCAIEIAATTLLSMARTADA